MGQAINKLKTRGAGEQQQQPDKQKEELRRIIDKYIEKHYPNFEEMTKEWNENQFHHAVYEIVEGISEESGAMQFHIPTIKALQEAFKDGRGNAVGPLDKKQFRKIVEKIVRYENIRIGQGTRDIFLYIFGAPIVALFAKRMIPGPTASISDDIFLPAVTSATVVYLAKTNKL